MNEIETPLKRVGAASGHGTKAWKAERISSVVLVPLSLWGLWSVGAIAGGGYEGALAWLRQPVNAVLLVALLGVSLWHMALGLRVVIEDYLHGFSGRLLLLLNTLFCLGLFLAAAASIASAVFGAGNGAS